MSTTRSCCTGDLLLATPTPGALPLAVHLPPTAGPAAPTRPWLLYAFDDPALQSLSAGQRILLRIGPDNLRRVKAWLGGLRAQRVATDSRP